MVTELLNMRNGQSPVSVCQSVSESVTMIIARDASASDNVKTELTRNQNFCNKVSYFSVSRQNTVKACLKSVQRSFVSPPLPIESALSCEQEAKSLVSKSLLQKN